MEQGRMIIGERLSLLALSATLRKEYQVKGVGSYKGKVTLTLVSSDGKDTRARMVPAGSLLTPFNR